MLRETAEKWIVICRLGLVACRQLLIAVFDQPGEKYYTQVTHFYPLVIDRPQSRQQDGPRGTEHVTGSSTHLGAAGMGRGLLPPPRRVHHGR